MKAVWNNKVIAESDETIVIDTFYYFPPDSVNYEFWKKVINTLYVIGKGKRAITRLM